MRDRSFFLLVAGAYLALAAFGVYHVQAHSASGHGGPILIGLFAGIAFGVIGLTRPTASADACRRCGGVSAKGVPFCGACGALP